jgi:hypothetical protein
MSIEKDNNLKISAKTDEYYEELAGQEEEYLEEGVEKLRERELLVSQATAKKLQQAEARAEEEREHEVEELVTGDSDDPPRSDDRVVAMLKKASNG